MTAVASLFRRNRVFRYSMIGVIVVLILSVAGDITRTEELTSPGTMGAALRLAVPIMLAGLGAVYSERAGIVNIGLEGMMIAGTWFGAWGSWQFGPWWGVLLGAVGGGLFGLLHAVATVTFNVDHIVSGVAINILGLGGMRFLSSIVYTPETGGSVVQSPTVPGTGRVSLPFLAGGDLFGWKTPDFFGWLDKQDWFFVSDIGGLLRGVTGDVNWLVVLAFALVPLTVWVLWRTPWGLRLRSCGEHPHAAESLGVPVYRMKYYGVVISGVFAGIGGAFLPLVQGGIYREGQTVGRGFIGLAALIFGNWMPVGVMGGGLLFGFGDSLRFRGPDVLRALLLAATIAAVLLALWRFYRRRHAQAWVFLGAAAVALAGHALLTPTPDIPVFELSSRWALIYRSLFVIGALGLVALAVWRWVRSHRLQAIVLAGVGFLVFRFSTIFMLEAGAGTLAMTGIEVPSQLLNAIPYVITLMVLALATQRLRMPAADGMRYRKGEEG